MSVLLLIATIVLMTALLVRELRAAVDRLLEALRAEVITPLAPAPVTLPIPLRLHCGHVAAAAVLHPGGVYVCQACHAQRAA